MRAKSKWDDEFGTSTPIPTTRPICAPTIAAVREYIEKYCEIADNYSSADVDLYTHRSTERATIKIEKTNLVRERAQAYSERKQK